jgi:hypothetical protein
MAVGTCMLVLRMFNPCMSPRKPPCWSPVAAVWFRCRGLAGCRTNYRSVGVEWAVESGAFVVSGSRSAQALVDRRIASTSKATTCSVASGLGLAIEAACAGHGSSVLVGAARRAESNVRPIVDVERAGYVGPYRNNLTQDVIAGNRSESSDRRWQSSASRSLPNFPSCATSALALAIARPRSRSCPLTLRRATVFRAGGLFTQVVRNLDKRSTRSTGAARRPGSRDREDRGYATGRACFAWPRQVGFGGFVCRGPVDGLGEQRLVLRTSSCSPTVDPFGRGERWCDRPIAQEPYRIK